MKKWCRFNLTQYTKSKLAPSTIWGIAITFILALFLLLFALQAERNLLRWDEVDFFLCMENVVRWGLPIYYAGEVNIDRSLLVHLSTRQLKGQEFAFYRYKPETRVLKETFFALTDGTSRYTYGMWHPPLYIYLGSLVFRFVYLPPENSHLLRYFNLIFSAGIFAGMWVLSRELYPSRHRQTFLLALLLYTLTPLSVRGSVLIDYNATLGPCVALWFIVTYLKEARQYPHLWLILSTTLVLFTSLGIAVNLFIAASLYSLITVALQGRDLQRHSGKAISVIAGIALFLATFYILCRLLYLPFSQPFLHNFHFTWIRTRATISSLVQWLSTSWDYFKWYMQEIGTPVMILFAILTAKSLFRVRRTPRHILLPITIATGLCTHAILRANAYWFPKYVLYLLPLLSVYLAGEALGAASASPTFRKIVFAVIAFILLVGMLDSLHWITYPGGTLYDKGQQGILTIARALRTVTAPQEIVFCPKDVGFFAERKFIQLWGAYFTDANRLRERIDEASVCYIVVFRGMLNGSTEIADFLNQEFFLQSEAGDFVLLRRKADHCSLSLPPNDR